MAGPAIEVRNLTKFYGPVKAVDDANFTVEPGEIVGFLGPNGAGKTTTMRVLTTWQPATSGVAKLAGFDVMIQSEDVRRHVGYLPESVPLYPEMRVEEYLNYRAKLKGVGRAGRTAAVGKAMDDCSLTGVRRRLVGTLSKGYRQRVGLADALVHNPPILILDEPTAGLDPIQIRATLQMIRKLAPKHTVLFSTHILSEVEQVAERVIIIDRGRIQEDAKLEELRGRDARLLFEVKAPVDAIVKNMNRSKKVTGVTTEELEDGWVRGEVSPIEAEDVREYLAGRLAEQGWLPRRLELRAENLGDVFARAVFRRDAEGGQ